MVDDDQVPFNPKISAAIRNRDIAALRDLLTAEPQQIHAFTPFAGGTWLHYAARQGDADAVQLLMSLGVDVNAGDARDGRAPICDACFGGHEDIVRLLLGAGAKLDTSDPVRNPLFAAVVGRSLPVAKLLLESGMDAGVRYEGPSMKQMDAVAFAIESGETEIANEVARKLANDNVEGVSRILEKARSVAEMNNR